MSQKKLSFIHVGKCGGSTIESLAKSSIILLKKYKEVVHVHVDGVQLDLNSDYLICLRNPISRAVSAFEWRRKLVLLDSNSNQKNRFIGERKALKRYKSLSEMSKKLYDSSGKLNQTVARDFFLIHHLRESISFYLDPLLPILGKSNVYGIICQETLSEDCMRLLGVVPGDMASRKNYQKKESISSFDDQAMSNLKKFLYKDYVCLTSLWSSGLLSDSQIKLLMFGN